MVVLTGLVSVASLACGKDGADGREGPPGAGADASTEGGAGGAGGAGAGSCVKAKPGTPATGSVTSEIAPAPAVIGADVPATYFGPPPSSVNPRLVGPVLLLKAGTVDLTAGTVTLPLYRGTIRATGKAVWHILTDTSDAANAAALGINFAAKLSYAALKGGKSTRSGDLVADGSIVFEGGTVDFSADRALTAGSPSPFPPTVANPGSMGDADYSPLVTLTNAGGYTYNAPIVAFGSSAAELEPSCKGPADHKLVHDKVVHICPAERTVTLALTTGFSFGRPVLYLSTEASVPLAATLEGATLAPGLADVRVGGDDGAFSAVERIFVTINGPQNIAGKVNPQRQGLNSAIVDGASPLNVLGGIPTIATDYSPLWDMNLGEWTADAIAKKYRSRLNEEFQILGMAQRGFITGPGGAPYGSVGIIVNCPIVQRLL
jgi:hypothetical protein